MEKVRWPLIAVAVYGGLVIVDTLLFVMLTALGALRPEAATALWALILLFFIVPFGAWLLVHGWVYVDAKRRGRHDLLWPLLSFFLFPVGPIVYLWLRQPRSAVCPVCGGVVQPRSTTCPHCGQNLVRVCASCGTALQAAWRACPTCGTGTPAASTGAQPGAPQPL